MNCGNETPISPNETCDCTVMRYLYDDSGHCNCTDDDRTVFNVKYERAQTIVHGVLGFFFALVLCCGVVGNGLVIFVVRSFKRMHSVTNVFLASLSVIDLLLVITCIPLQYAKFLMHCWPLGSFICYALHYLQAFTKNCSVLTLTAISVERYIAIVHPMRAIWIRRVGNAYRVVVFLWLFAAVLAVPDAVGMKYDSFLIANTTTCYYCLRNDASRNVVIFYGYYEFITVLLLPLITMCYCYLKVTLTLQRAPKTSAQSIRQPANLRETERGKKGANGTKKQNDTTLLLLMSATTTLSPAMRDQYSNAIIRKTCRAGDKENRNKRKIIQMQVVVVSIFVICWLPFVLDDLLTALYVLCLRSQQHNSRWLVYFRNCTAVIAFANSCVNPIVYAFMSKHFRTTFAASWHRLSRRHPKTEPAENDMRHLINYMINRTLSPSTSFIRRISRSTSMMQNPRCSPTSSLRNLHRNSRRSSDNSQFSPTDSGRNSLCYERTPGPRMRLDSDGRLMLPDGAAPIRLETIISSGLVEGSTISGAPHSTSSRHSSTYSEDRAVECPTIVVSKFR